MNDIDYTWDLSTEVVAAPAEGFALELDHFDQLEQEDKLWQARTGLNHDTLCGAVETLIFMSDRPITLQKIKAQIDAELPLRVLHDALTRLQKGYEDKHHGIRLAEVAEGWQFRTKATYAKHVQNLFKVQGLVLTPTALEVLAIIAYRQPVSKTEVERIRGVDSSHVVRALMDKRLVTITGRSEELGRPSLYGTTPEFLEVFNLANIEELPPEHELAELATRNTVGHITDIKNVVFMGDKTKFNYDELDELDRLSASIKDIAAETDFTMLLKQEEKRRIEDSSQGPKRSAFDILEEFVVKEDSVRQNRLAVVSELPMSVVEPRLADIAALKLLNVPQVDSEWEEERNQSLATEAEELGRALEEAFGKLVGEELTDPAGDVNLDEQLKALDFTVDSAIKQGVDMDLDLSFLAEALPEDDNPDQPL